MIMKKLSICALATITFAVLCACSGNKAKEQQTEQIKADSIAAAALQDSIEADSIAKAEAAAKEAAKLDPEEMKAVVLKMFSIDWEKQPTLMSKEWRKKNEKQFHMTDASLLIDGTDCGLENIKVTSVDAATGVVKVSAVETMPGDDEAEDGIGREDLHFTFKIVKEDGIHLIDKIDIKNILAN